MSGDRFDQNPQSAPVLQLLVELPSWPQVFFGNLRDLVFPRRLPPLELRSAPAPFWPDVLVKRRLPWNRFLESALCHLIAIELVIAATHFFALQPHAMPRPTFDHAQIVYDQPSEYLPPIDTRSAHAAKPVKADPEFSRQPIISLPPEPDNRSQTIVAPPNVKLKHDVALPNIVAWSDREKPRLAIPPVPLTPAAEITRIAPQLENSVVAPAPDASRLTHRRDGPNLQTAVVAPPPDLRASRTAVLDAPEPAVIAPPPSVQNSARLGDINIGRSSVIAPAPQLAVGEQRAVAGGRSRSAAGAMQVVAPPPSLSASGASGQSFGSRGRTIALNLHPTVGAPPDPPAGNRRGAFAATPEGHSGASGSPGATGHSDGSKGNGNGSSRKGAGDLPAGLYVGNPAAKPSPVAGDPAKAGSTNSVNPNLIASVRPPRATSERPMQPADSSKLTEQERVVFGNRKFYSLTLNMPNLNSAGGSWVIRFAEMKQDPKAPAADISQPVATRKVDPAYPTQLMHENVSGTVILYAVIHADGTVGNLRILRGVDSRLDQFAGQALTQWRFEPATKNGVPVDVEATFHIPFHPSHQGF